MTEQQPEQPRSTEPAAADRPQPKSEKTTLADLAILIVEAGLLTACFSAVIFVAGWSIPSRPTMADIARSRTSRAASLTSS